MKVFFVRILLMKGLIGLSKPRGVVNEVNPSIIHKIESMEVPSVVQQFLKELLSVEVNSGGDKSEAIGAVIDEYIKNPEIEKWMQKASV